MAITNKCGERISDWVQDFVMDESYLIPTYNDNEIKDLVIKLDGLIWLFNRLSRPKSARLIRRCQHLLSERLLNNGDKPAVSSLSE